MGRRACGLVIFRKFRNSIEYLLLQASYGQKHWTPPKGHVDPGENDFETALRETEEESGFVQDDLKIYMDAVQEIEYIVKGKPKTVIYWLAELINRDKDVRLSREHIDFTWLPIEQSCTLADYLEMQKVLRNCNEYVMKNIVNSS